MIRDVHIRNFRRRAFSHGLVVLLCLATGLPLWAQRDTEALRVTVDRTAILIGEPFVLTVSCRFPVTAAIGSRPVIPDTLGRFEMILRLSVDSAEASGIRTVTQRFRLTSFDSGRQVIPAISFQAGSRRFSSDTIGIDVEIPPMQTDAYHDIRDIIETQPSGLPLRWLLPLLASIFLLILAIYWWRNKKSRNGPYTYPGKLSGSVYQDTLDALSALRNELAGTEVPGSDEYRRLYDLFRAYLVQDHGMPVMTETTDEILIRMKAEGLTPPGLANLAAALRLADAVKFARYRSSGAEALSALDQVTSIVTFLHQKNQKLA